MRVVQFASTGDVITYPFEGISAFGSTELVGGFVVGEYNGTASPTSLPDYDGFNGPWPFLVPPTFVTEYKTDIWRDDVITSPEWELLIDSNDNAIKKLLKQISGRNGLLDVTDSVYVNAIGAGLTETIFDQARHDELIQGLPA